MTSPLEKKIAEEIERIKALPEIKKVFLDVFGDYHEDWEDLEYELHASLLEVARASLDAVDVEKETHISWKEMYRDGYNSAISAKQEKRRAWEGLEGDANTQ